MVENINKTMFWLFTMLFAGVVVWALVMSVHHSHAKAYDNQEISRAAQAELKLKPRGPGGPPVVLLGDWRIIATITPDAPTGGAATLGDPVKNGPMTWDTEAECLTALKKDPVVQQRKAIVAAMQQRSPGVFVFYHCEYFGQRGGERVD